MPSVLHLTIPVKPQERSNSLLSMKKQLEPKENLKIGSLVKVTIAIDAREELPDAVLLDLLPAGFEIEDGTLATRQKMPAVLDSGLRPRHRENRADRYLFFGKVPFGASHIVYYMRAVSPGNVALPAANLEDMYQPQLQAVSTPGQRIQVAP